METEITRWLSLNQAARRLGVTPQMTHIYCRRGKLRFIVTALGRLIDPESVEQLAQSGAIKKSRRLYDGGGKEEGGDETLCPSP